MRFKKLWPRLTIKQKLIGFFTIALTVCVMAITIPMAYSSAHILRELEHRNARQIMLAAQQTLEDSINSVNASLLAVQTNATVQRILSEPVGEGNALEEEKELAWVLRTVDPFCQMISRMEIYAENKPDYPMQGDGGCIFGTGDMVNDPWYRMMRTVGPETRWTVTDSIYESKRTVTASKNLYDVNTDRYVGIVRATITVNDFTRAISNVALGNSGCIVLATENSILRSPQSWLNAQLANNDMLFNQLIPQGVQTEGAIYFGEEKYLLLVNPLGQTKMYLVGAAKSEEFGATARSLLLTFGVVLLVAIALMFLLIYLISAGVTRPLYQLAERVKKYEYQKMPDKVAYNAEEITMLSDTFDSMVSQIQAETHQRHMAELKALQSQITPHFLYNTLNSINALAARYKADDIEEMICALPRYLRRTLNDGAEMTTLEKEMEHVESYVFIQKVRFGDSFDLVTDIPQELTQCPVCKLILQPLVENCILHAFDGIDWKGLIRINARREGAYVCIQVADNGIGMDGVSIEELNRYSEKDFDPNKPIAKYGIYNVGTRIKFCFGKDCGLHYSKAGDGGTVVQVRIKDLRETEVSADG